MISSVLSRRFTVVTVIRGRGGEILSALQRQLHAKGRLAPLRAARTMGGCVSLFSSARSRQKANLGREVEAPYYEKIYRHALWLAIPFYKNHSMDFPRFSCPISVEVVTSFTKPGHLLPISCII